MRTCRLGRSGACGVKAGAAAPLPALRGPREEGARGFPQRRWAPRADRTCETTGRWRAVCKASWCEGSAEGRGWAQGKQAQPPAPCGGEGDSRQRLAHTHPAGRGRWDGREEGTGVGALRQVPRGLSLPPSNLTAGASWETGTRDRKGNVLPRGGGGGPPELSPHFPSSKPPGPRQAMPPPRTH